MTRNLDFRVEVTCPVYDTRHQEFLQELFDIQWRDNVKARVLDRDLKNKYRKKGKKKPAVRSQIAIADYLESLL